MTGVGTAAQPSLHSRPRVSLVAGLSLAGLIFLSVGVHAWFHGGKERMLLLLQPDFTVMGMDRQAQTLSLSRVQENFVVSCGDRCNLFEVGKHYSMLRRRDSLEFTRKGERMKLPILREHFDFATPPGGHG